MSKLNQSICKFILLPVAGIVAFASTINAETVRTKSFLINIDRQCEEGNVSCDRVTYVGTDLKTGKAIRLVGKTINSRGSYRFLGYEFRNGKYRYVISGDNYSLLVYKGDKLILQEKGDVIDN
jgi:hypothetical protein